MNWTRKRSQTDLKRSIFQRLQYFNLTGVLLAFANRKCCSASPTWFFLVGRLSRSCCWCLFVGVGAGCFVDLAAGYCFHRAAGDVGVRHCSLPKKGEEERRQRSFIFWMFSPESSGRRKIDKESGRRRGERRALGFLRPLMLFLLGGDGRENKNWRESGEILAETRRLLTG